MINNKLYHNYLQVCTDATNDDKVFSNFKNNHFYREILEHVTYEQGLEYIDHIKDSPIVQSQLLDKFLTNDLIGNPLIYYYPEIEKTVSPTTLRYIKVLIDLISVFGDIDFLDIVEIGGGYGGQCKIIQDYKQQRSYTLIDLSEVLNLCGKYLSSNKIRNFILQSSDIDNIIEYDLCISNYAFTEIDRFYQNIYVEKVIKHSTHGFITCNFMDSAKKDGRMTKNEILNLKENYKIFEETPQTAIDNFIYTW
jgi:putative sugar O-methyltransferase